MKWFVYIVKCKDDSLYTGITTDPKRREHEHNSDRIRGAKSLSGRLPVKLIYKEVYNNQKDAAKREREIKGWRREKKLSLIIKNDS
jgi:putative endonuclease